MPTYNAGEARLAVVPDAGGFKRKLETEMRKVRAEFPLTVTANTAQARADIDRFRELQQRNGIALGVDVALAQASADMEAWRARQRAAGLVVSVDADTGDATRQIDRLRKQFDGGAILSALKWNAGALTLGSLPAIGTVLAQVTAGVQQLSQAGLAVPGIFAGIAGSVGTAMVGFSGVKDAVEALNKATDGTPESLAKADAALKALDPNAAAVAKTLAGLKPALDILRGDVQGKMLVGISDTIKTLADNDLPVLQKGMGQIATSWNSTLKQLGTSLGSESSRGLLDRILGNTAEAQARFNSAIDPLVHGLATLTAAGTDVLPRLADGLAKASDRFNRFITAADNDGRLDKWINDGITGLSHLGETVLNLGKSVTAITKAVGGGEGFLSMLERGTGALQEFLNSDRGQERLTRFFTEGKKQLNKWLPVLQNLGSNLVSVYEGAKQWTDALLPPLRTITGFLADHPGLIRNVVTAFLAWKTLTGVTSLLGLLGNIGSNLDGLPGRASRSAGGIKNAFSGLKGLGAGLGLGLAIDGLSTPGDQPPKSAAVVGGAALVGASLGGVPGAIVGAGVGAVADYVAREKAWNQRVDAYKKALGDAPTASAKHAIDAQFYKNESGVDINDPGRLADISPDSTLYKSLRDRLAQGNIVPGVDASNADAALANLIEQAKHARDNIELIKNGIETLPSGQVVLKEDTPEAIQRVKDLGYAVQNLPDGHLEIRVVYRDQNGNPIDPAQLRVSQRQLSAAAGNEGTIPRRARGGIAGRTPAGQLWGPGTPTSDSILGVDAHGMPTALVSAGEGVVNYAAMQRPGVAQLVSRLNGYWGGTGQDGVLPPGGPAPVAPAPDQAGGLMSAANGIVSGLMGSLGTALNVGPGLMNIGAPAAGGGAGGIGRAALGDGAGPLSLADRFAGMPGLFGFFGSLGSSDPSGNLLDWGQQTGQWLGDFTAKTGGGFLSALWTGALGLVGLDNSILSPTNPWFQDAAQVGQFGLGQDGFLGALFGGDSATGTGKKGRKGATDKQIREANDKVTDRDDAVERALQRLNELPANAKQSTRTAAQDAYNRAVREAAQSRDDLQALMSGQTVMSATKPAGLSGTQGVVYQAMLNAGFGGSEWSALQNILNKESGFDAAARNPTSGAFGMYQFLGHENDKYGALGAYSSDPAQQSVAGMQYIKDRYGSPSNAWAFWQANGWYANGGAVQGFDSGGEVQDPGSKSLWNQVAGVLFSNPKVNEFLFGKPFEPKPLVGKNGQPFLDKNGQPMMEGPPLELGVVNGPRALLQKAAEEAAAKSARGVSLSRSPAYLNHNIPLSPENAYRGVNAARLDELFDPTGVMRGFGKGGTDNLSFQQAFPNDLYVNGLVKSNMIIEGGPKLPWLGRAEGRSGYRYSAPLSRDAVEAGETPLRVWMREITGDQPIESVHSWKTIFDSFPIIGRAGGGGVRGPGGPKDDRIPAMLSNGEFVQQTAAVDKYGLPFMHKLNAGLIDPAEVRYLAEGGAPRSLPPLPPNLQQDKRFQQMQPPPRPPAQVAPPAASVPPASSASEAAGIGSAATARPASVAPVAPGPASSSADAYDHNLAAINTGIDSTASVVGNAISTAMSIGSMGAAAGGMPGAGSAMSGLASYAAGLAQQGGKIAKDVVNVGSSFLVGSVPGSFGTTDNAYGETLRPPQNVPQTAEYHGGSRTYNIQAGYRMQDLMDAVQLKEAQDSQGPLAQWANA